MKKYLKYPIVFAGLMMLVISSCKIKEEEKEDFSKENGNYFSIKQFGLDQWNNFGGPTFTIMKTVRRDGGKPDSFLTNSDTLNWSVIFKTFFETDISDRKYLGQYKFSQFDDNGDGTHNFFYEAKDDDLFTQKLLITIDVYTNKVKGVYIETMKKEFMMGEQIQKLYYNPYKTIQIQMDEKTTFGKKKFSVVQYDFMI